MKLGCGLFGVAKDLEKDFWGTMRQLKEGGFTAVEPMYGFEEVSQVSEGGMPSWLKTIIWDKAKIMAVKPKLKEMGLEIPTIHVGLLFCKDTEKAVQELVELSKETGIKHFITSMLFDTKEKCENAAQLLTKANKILSETGASLIYHNHEYEMNEIKIGGTKISLIDYFIKITDKSVQVQLDTGWMLYGGKDPVEFIKTYPDRICSIHLKDIVPAFLTKERNHIFTQIGNGALPVRSILEATEYLSLIEHGIMIDQDGPEDYHEILEDLKKGSAFLQCLEENTSKMTLSVFYPNVVQMSNEKKQSILETLLEIKELGISQIYVDYPGIINNKEEFLQILECSGMTISGIFDFYDFYKDFQMERCKEAIDFAADNQVKHLLVVPGDIPREPQEARQEGLDKIVNCMKIVCDYGKVKGVHIEMEDSDGGLPYCKDEELLWFLSRVQGLDLCFDTGNFCFGGVDLEKAYHLLVSYITNIHLKDRDKSMNCTAIGQGNLEISRIIQYLRKSNYRGAMNIELFGVENMEKAITESVAWIKKKM